MSKPGNLWRKIHGKITKRPTNFSWLIENKLAGCGMPTSFEEMNWIRNQGVKSIVTMTEESLPNSWLDEIEYLHVPTEDLTAPDLEKIDSAVDYIDERIKNKEPVMVHCAAGIGRTGTILASYLIKYQKMTAKDAIEKLRNERPGSVQSDVQEMAVSMYEKYLKHKD
ncbi:dual specificity protein phosphatase 23 [Candidatus Nitrosotenuis chungbukensis]|jgi:atypical dual specificity phosphatase|uniref:dual specificity protein phosphatase 23 n=1 Tax=Candidatus Nitrosotenuis chungbukensis TaxID=1353246 RepID=UPI0005B26056|nr:dual specificity protein phosphatase 23 [Candidatus Nitrosotenuis chungbukensis]WKT58489.1 dual specificity protein phosphatase 23 [Candidatus Nitrosotenuis chungbukensis]